MEAVSTPRISANMLDSYVGQNVIIVGKVMQLRGESALLDASGQVNAILNRESHLMAGNGAQIIGRVNPDLSVKVYNALDLGSNVDFQIAQSVVEITQQHRDLFVEVYSSSSSINNELSQLVIQPNISPSSQPITTQGTLSSRLIHQSTSRDHPITAESRRSSSSETTSSASSSNDEFSRLIVAHNEPSPSQLVTSPSRHSSSGETFGSVSSLDNELSRLIVDHDQPPSSQFTTAGSYQSRQPNVPRASSPRPATAASYYSSSSSVSSSVSDSLDEIFSQQGAEEETPQSSQSTTQPCQPRPRSGGSSECSGSSIPTTPVREHEVPSPVYGSPSSTGKLSNGPPSRIQSPVLSTPPSSTRSPRLYRTSSGSLASVAELRQRREREEQLLDIVLAGIVVLGGASPRRSVSMRLDENGRWRINSIREPWGP
ncbi:hypothetical protein EKO27_g7953 [Xylaria grammica]|uniref:Replication factor A protein 3 n=1 Tax=Xylaria grammica TaxID=363999 RepID=A0A439CY42_9PEZI|nr:hypothetical protein EKO27_g7953 [Xylaria grammica]